MRGLFASLFVVVVTVGCSEPAPPMRRSEPMLEKQQALVTIQFYEGERPTTSCAGVLVGPQAVLTAGHCASKKYRAVIVAPNAGGKEATSSRAWWFDWTDDATPKTSPQLHDVAILALDAPIELPSYPKISETSLPSGSRTVHVRRVKQGRGIRFAAVSGNTRETKAGAHHHRINAKDDKVDSGGPVFDPETGKIVGVVSARAGSGVLHVSKTKALSKWLRQQLLALLKSAPKTDRKPDAGNTAPPKPPPAGQSPPAKSDRMGKQSGGGTKSPSNKSGGDKSQNQTPKDGNSEQDKETEQECEGGDLTCEDICEGGGGEDCDTECEGGDDSCEPPECEGGECDCEGEECDGEIEDEEDYEGDYGDDGYGDEDYGDYGGDDYGGDDYGGDDYGGDYGGDDYGGEE